MTSTTTGPEEIATGTQEPQNLEIGELRYFGADPGWKLLDLKELWTYRELLATFTLRDVKVRYRQAIVGVLWVVMQPVVMMLIFGVIFQLVGKQPTATGVPYQLSAFVGLIAWQLVAYSLRESANSLLANRQLITKVYFPRVLLPASVIGVGLVDFAVAFVVLIPLMLWFGFVPGITVLCVPLFVALAMIAAFAAALWLSALNALYRDIGYVVPFVIQVGFFVSPVMYDTESMIPDRWWWYGLNPMVSIIAGLRWSLLGTPAPSWTMMLLSTSIVFVLLVTGLLYFRRTQQWIADLV